MFTGLSAAMRHKFVMPILVNAGTLPVETPE
jgi:hypothetical protein